MSHRNLFSKAYLASVIVMAFLLSFPLVSFGAVTLKFAHIRPPGASDVEGMQKFKKLIEERSKGEIKVELFLGGVLGGERDEAEAIKVGEIDMTMIGDVAWDMYCPELFITGVPFLLPNEDTANKLWDKIYERSKPIYLEKGKVVILGLLRRSPRDLTTKSKKVFTPEDMKNIKIRLPEVRTWVPVWKQLGTLPTPIAAPEIYTSLQLGVVEAQENPVATVTTRKLYEVQKYFVLTEHIYARWSWFISQLTYDKLSAEHKKLVTECAQEALDYASNWDRENETKLMVDVQRKGMQVIVPDKKTFYEKAKPAIDELKKNWAPGMDKLVEEVIR